MLYLDMFMAMFIVMIDVDVSACGDTARWSGLVATRKVLTPAPAAPAWEDWGEVIGMVYISLYGYGSIPIDTFLVG